MQAGSGQPFVTRRRFLKRALQVCLASWLPPGLALPRTAAGGAGPFFPFDSPAPIAQPPPSAWRVGATYTGGGPWAPFGEQVRRALLLWEEKLRSQAAPGAPPIELDLQDDQGSPDKAQAHFRRFAETAHAAIAPYGSVLTGAILPICRQAGLPVLLPSAADPALDLAGGPGEPPIGFALLPPNEEALTGALDWAAAQGAKRVALLFRDDPFSAQAARGVRRRAEELQLRIVWDESYADSRGIWEAAVRRFGPGRAASPAEPEAELLIGGGYAPGGEASGFLPDAREIVIAFEARVRWMALLVAPTFPVFAERLGARAEGVLGGTNWKPWFDRPGNAAFVAAFQKRWGGEPDTHAAAAYAAGQLIEAARLQAAGRRHVPEGLDAARLWIRRALAALETETVFGPFAVDARGLQRRHAYTLLQWRGGRLIPVWPKSETRKTAAPKAARLK